MKELHITRSMNGKSCQADNLVSISIGPKNPPDMIDQPIYSCTSWEIPSPTPKNETAMTGFRHLRSVAQNHSRASFLE